MDRIIKKCPCSLEVWWGAGEPLYKESNLYFNNKKEVREYLNERLQTCKGETIECYVYQHHKGKSHESFVCFEVK